MKHYLVQWQSPGQVPSEIRTRHLNIACAVAEQHRPCTVVEVKPHPDRLGETQETVLAYDVLPGQGLIGDHLTVSVDVLLGHLIRSLTLKTQDPLAACDFMAARLVFVRTRVVEEVLRS